MCWLKITSSQGILPRCLLEPEGRTMVRMEAGIFTHTITSVRNHQILLTGAVQTNQPMPLLILHMVRQLIRLQVILYSPTHPVSLTQHRISLSNPPLPPSTQELLSAHH